MKSGREGRCTSGAKASTLTPPEGVSLTWAAEQTVREIPGGHRNPTQPSDPRHGAAKGRPSDVQGPLSRTGVVLVTGGLGRAQASVQSVGGAKRRKILGTRMEEVPFPPF